MMIKKISLNKKTRLILSTATVVLLLLFITFVNLTDSNDKKVISITESELNQTINQNRTFFEVNNQEINLETLRLDAENQITARMIVEDYAKNNDISVSNDELQEYYSSRVQQHNDEQELLDKIKQTYNIDKDTYLKQIEYDILRDKVQQNLNQTLSEWVEAQKPNYILVIE